MADSGDRAEPGDHLLIDNQHGDQQHEDPQQAGAVVLPGLGVRGDAARVVVAEHHDQAGAHDREQAAQPPGPAGRLVLGTGPDGAEGALDVAEVRRGSGCPRRGAAGGDAGANAGGRRAGDDAGGRRAGDDAGGRRGRGRGRGYGGTARADPGSAGSG